MIDDPAYPMALLLTVEEELRTRLSLRHLYYSAGWTDWLVENRAEIRKLVWMLRKMRDILERTAS